MVYIGHSDIVNRDNMGHIAVMAVEPVYTVKKLVAMTPDMAAAISTYRFDSRISAEAEAIRRLIELGLNATTSSGGASKRDKQTTETQPTITGRPQLPGDLS